MKRRTVLLGLGASAAGGGAALGTGAFDSATANRDATVAVASDANAYLGLAPTNKTYADTSTVDGNDIIELEFTDNGGEGGSGLGKNSTYEFDNLFDITNQGTDPIELVYVIDPGTDGNGHGGIEEFNLYEGDDPNTKLSRGPDSESGKTLGIGDTVSVGVEIETTKETVDSSPDNQLTVRLRTIDTDPQGGEDGNTITVSNEASDDDSSSFKTIQAAESNAKPGDIIEIKSGTYTTGTTISTANITIQGEQTAKPTFKTVGLNIEETGVEIKNLEFTNFTQALQIGAGDANGNRSPANGTTVKNCTFRFTDEFNTDTGGATQAILAHGGSEDIKIRNCNIGPITAKAPDGDFNNQVQGVLVGFRGGADVTVDNVSITDIDGHYIAYGLQIRESSSVTIEDSSISGISGDDSQSPIDDETILDIFDNPDDNYASTAITFSSPESLEIRRTDFGGNSDDSTQVGVRVNSASTNFEFVARNNNFEVPVGIQHETGAEPLDAKECWWDSPNGPTPLASIEDEDLPLSASTVIGSVDYVPWLDDRAPDGEPVTSQDQS